MQFAYPLSNQDFPRDSITGWSKYAETVTPGTNPPLKPYSFASSSLWIWFSESGAVFKAVASLSFSSFSSLFFIDDFVFSLFEFSFSSLVLD